MKNEQKSKPKGPKQGGHKGRAVAPVKEIGGRKGPEPVRFGDWEKNGRCIDF